MSPKSRKSLKIVVGYPPTLSEKGTPLLSQNRQFQYFDNPTFLFPVTLATGATWLRSEGYPTLWKDCIPEYWNTEKFYKYLDKERPDLFIFESKSPVIKTHWHIIDLLKKKYPKMKICITGDHVSAFPEETMQSSKVDFLVCGGYYDFAMVELADALENNEEIPRGIWHRKAGKIIDNGRYELKKKLDDAPIVDRKFTRNDLYQKEFNLVGRPLAYIMSGRDCWWGRCTFCFHPETNIITEEGIKEIKNIKLGDNILTHTGKYSKNNLVFQRPYKGEMIYIKPSNLPEEIICTPNHKLFGIKKGKTEAEFIEAENIEKGDKVTFPIIKEIEDITQIDSYEILKEELTEIPINVNRLSNNKVQQIMLLHDQDNSQRTIARELKIDRETVKSYIKNESKGIIKLETDNEKVYFSNGKTEIPRKIKIENDFLRLVGYYLAEGNTHIENNRPNSGVLQFTFYKEEREYIEDVKKLLEKYFKAKVYLVKNEANNTIQITVYSNVIAHLFKKLFGKNCLEKTIPKQFMKLPLEKQRELIKGLFRGDAHLRPENRSPEYILNTTSKQLAYKTWMILTRLEIIPSFYISPKETREKAKNDQYVLSICGTDIPKLEFAERKLKYPNKAYRNVEINNNYATFEIKTIKKEKYEGFVYNTSIPGDQSYTANLIGVSNCVWDHTLYPKGTFRARTPENVLEEVKYLVDECGVKEIFDDAGTITVGPWLKKFCELMIESGYNKKVMYSCNMRFGAVNLEEYKLMKKAGFRLLKYGLESGCQKTIDKLDKGTRVDEVAASCRDAKKAGLTVHLTMMVGYPWETKEDAMKTVKFSRYLMRKGYADVLQSTVVIPYPGTPLWKEGIEKGWFRQGIDPYDYERFDMAEPVLNVPGMTPAEVEGLCRQNYYIFLHPEYILRHLAKIRSFQDVMYTLKGAKAVFGHLKDFSRQIQ